MQITKPAVPFNNANHGGLFPIKNRALHAKKLLIIQEVTQ